MFVSKLFVWAMLASPVVGTTYDIMAGMDWSTHLTSLQPGDVLTLHPQTPGTAYTYTVNFRNAFALHGTIAQPIIVQGAPGESITMLMNANQNVCEIVGEYFVFQNLRLTANNNVATSAIGLRLGVGGASATVSHAIIKNVTVFNVPETAFTANFHDNHYTNITFDGCEAYNTGGTGECFYVGCQGANSSDIACQFVNGALINNYCHDTCKPNGCSGGSIGSGYQLKGWGSYGNLVRNNVCASVNSVCVLIYDDWDLGVNIVEGNWIFGSVTDAGIQVAAGAIIRNNVLFGNKRGINVQSNSVNLQMGKLNRNIQIVGNTLVNNSGTGLVLPTFSPVTGTRIVNNVVIEDTGNAFSANDQSGVTWLNNAYHGGSVPAGVGATGVKLVGTASVELQNPSGYNFHPKAGSALLAAGAALTAATDVTYDFSCNTRAAIPTAGAYESSTGAALTLGFQAGCQTPTSGSKAPTPLGSTNAPTPMGSSSAPSMSTTNFASATAPAFLLLVGAVLVLL